jgi:hypothetical protein
MSWARQEFESLELGDARRTQRLIRLVDDLSAQPTGSIPLASGGWAETKAAYRLLDNDALDRAHGGANAGLSVRLVHPGHD